MSIYTIDDCSLSTISNCSLNTSSINKILYRLEEVEKNQSRMIEKFDKMIQSVFRKKNKFMSRKKIRNDDFRNTSEKLSENTCKKPKKHNKYDNKH